MSAPNTFYITTPIYYVNDVPHIGHAYTTVAADVLARYWRLRGRDVFFLTGLDEHGQKVQQAATKAGIDPQAHCDKLAPQFQALWKRLNISNDAFIRTTNGGHKSVVQRYLQQLYDNQQIYKADYTGWYCTFDERFWTEKDVENGLCPECKRPVEKLSEHNYFFKMGQYQDRLIDHIRTHPRFIQPESRRNEVLGFLTTQKLGDLSISRPKSRLSWGIELPFDKNYVTYVWFDALVNYVSALEYLRPAPSRDQYWPASVHLVVVDPNKIVDEFGADAFRYFLLREVPFGQDGDFSIQALARRTNSDLANGIGNLLSRTLTMIDRYCDSTIPDVPQDYIENDSLLLHPKEQLLTLGRHLDGFFEGSEFNNLLLHITSRVTDVDIFIDEHEPWRLAKDPDKRKELNAVLYTAAECLRILSLYIYPFMPSTAKNISEQLGINVAFDSALLSQEVKWGELQSGTKILKGSALFPRIVHTANTVTIGEHVSVTLSKNAIQKPQGAKTVSDATTPPQPTTAIPAPTTAAPQTPAPAAPAPVAPAQITIDEFMKIQLKTAKVLAAERVPKSEKLLKLQVSLGEGTEPRQIVAGIGKKYTPDALIGKTIIIVANLKPAKLMGIESQGMVLAAGDSEVSGLATIFEEVDPGTKVK